jgi:hypothetical protein
MKKKAALRLTCLAAGCASLFAVAALDLTPLTQATSALNDCAAVANSIAAIPVPPNQAKATMAAATNEATADPKQKIAVDPAQAAFADQMKDGAAKLDACGKNVRTANGQANDFVRGLNPANMTKDDATALKTAYETYSKAQADMRTAIVALTSDHVRATYMRAPLHANFLQPAGPNSGSGPRRAQQ